MIKKLYILLFFLFVILSDCFSQISWSYVVLFNIYDKDKNRFTEQDFLEGRIKVYSSPFGAHTNNPMYYKKEFDSFIFSQGTIIDGSQLIFKVGDELMILNIRTRNLFLNEIIFEPGRFCLPIRWKDEDAYEIKPCERFKPIYVLKEEISYYRCDNKEELDINRLEEIRYKIY